MFPPQIKIVAKVGTLAKSAYHDLSSHSIFEWNALNKALRFRERSMNSFHPQTVAKVNSGISASGTKISVSMAGEADAGSSHPADLVSRFQCEENMIVDAVLYVVDEKAGIPCDREIGFGVWFGRRSAHFSSHSPAFSPWVSKQLPRVAPKLTT